MFLNPGIPLPALKRGEGRFVDSKQRSLRIPHFVEEINLQRIDVNQLDDSTMRRLNLAIPVSRSEDREAGMGFSGAVTAGLVASFCLGGWGVAIAALLGRVCRMNFHLEWAHRPASFPKFHGVMNADPPAQTSPSFHRWL